VVLKIEAPKERQRERGGGVVVHLIPNFREPLLFFIFIFCLFLLLAPPPPRDACCSSNFLIVFKHLAILTLITSLTY
jgi:phosphatidylglycerophosphate synthase